MSDLGALIAQLRADGVVEVSSPMKCGDELPAALRELYEVTDGLYDPAGRYFLVWPLSRVLAGLDGPPIGFTAFGDDGTGDPFLIDPAAAVHHMNSIDAEVRLIAPSLEAMLIGWFDGTPLGADGAPAGSSGLQR